MKRAILLRHAKANPSTGEPDHERRLNQRGITAARLAGEALAAGGWISDQTLVSLALVSDAVRTRQTFEHAAPALPAGLAVRITPALYGATAEQMLNLIQDAPAEADCLLVVGHNPGIGELARRLTALGSKDDRARLAARFPTAAIAVIRFETTLWPEIGAGGKLEAYLWPDPLGPTD